MSTTDAREPLLEVVGLRAGYGQSQVLDGVDFSMGRESIAIIGRNGVGKTTLCKTLMGLIRPSGGHIRFAGSNTERRQPEKIARMGMAYVPQGRRLFPSLSVDEHLAMLAKGTRGKRWTPEAVYDLFPRLANRRNNGGAELSGGEQQMLSVGRALLLNAQLMIMDEPSEGLAPQIVDSLIDVVHTLVKEGHSVLVVEQNLHAATSMAERQLVMVAGRIEAESTAAELLASSELQRQYLGVEA